MSLADYLQLQLKEALGAVNRWYCSQFYGREVTDANTLMVYYVKHGGAEACRRQHPEVK